MELKIDRDCENIFALFDPVAVDLRFVMASFKKNSDLERLGDHATSIAKYVVDFGQPIKDKAVKKMRRIRQRNLLKVILRILTIFYLFSIIRKLERVGDLTKRGVTPKFHMKLQ